MTWDGVNRREKPEGVDVEDVIARTADRVVHEAVPKAINTAFKRLGIDADDPIQVQKQMAYLEDSAARSGDPEVIADRAFLRQTRVRCEAFWNKFYDTFTGLFAKFFYLALFIGGGTLIGVQTGVLEGLIK